MPSCHVITRVVEDARRRDVFLGRRHVAAAHDSGLY